MARKINGLVTGPSDFKWGVIQGSIENQTDLVNFIEEKNNEVKKLISNEETEREFADDSLKLLVEEESDARKISDDNLQAALDDEISARVTYNKNNDKVIEQLKKDIRPVTDAASKEWVNEQGFLKEHQSLDEYAKKEWVEDKHYLTEHQSLSGYATEEWVNNKHYLTQHQSLENYYSKNEVDVKDNQIKELIPTIPSNVSYFNNDAGYLTNHQDVSNLASKDELTIVESKIVPASIVATKQELSGVNDKIPTSTSQLINDSGYLTQHQSLNAYAKKTEIPDVSNFITASVTNLVNYYAKDNSYTKKEVNDLISSISSVRFEVVQTLPAIGEANVIYLIPSSSKPNVFEQWVYVNGWRQIGSTEVDLSEYATRQWVLDKNYLTEHQDISNKANVSDLNDHTNNYQIHLNNELKTYWDSKSEFSGKYEDLANKPSIPTRTSELNNDSNFINVDFLSDYATKQWTESKNYVVRDDLSDYATKLYVGSQGYATISNLQLHTLNSDIHMSSDDRERWNSKSDFSGDYNDLTNKPEIRIVTKLSELQNDTGFLIEADLEPYATNDRVNEVESEIPDISNLASKQWVEDKHYLEPQTLNQYYDKTNVDSLLLRKADNVLASKLTQGQVIVGENIAVNDGVISVKSYDSDVSELTSRVSNLEEKVAIDEWSIVDTGTSLDFVKVSKGV